MLKNTDITAVDELYLNIVEKGRIIRIGINNGVIVDPSLVDPKQLMPTTSVRILGTPANIPLLLAAHTAYQVSVEVCPYQLMFGSGSESVRDLVIRTRNGHRSLPEHHPLRYWTVTPSDLYSFGLVYWLWTKKLGSPEHKFLKEDLDFSLNREYIDNAVETHAMRDNFSTEHAIDFCGAVIDPRLHLGPGGRFKYYMLPRVLGFGSLEIACQLTRKVTELHGPDPLPYSGPSVKQMVQKLIGTPASSSSRGYPNHVLGLRVLHGILNTPLDNLNVTLKAQNTRLARDAEVVRQRMHFLINDWFSRIREDWVKDEYDPDAFIEPQQTEDEED